MLVECNERSPERYFGIRELHLERLQLAKQKEVLWQIVVGGNDQECTRS